MSTKIVQILEKRKNIASPESCAHSSSTQYTPDITDNNEC